jgi:hypothetical protein
MAISTRLDNTVGVNSSNNASGITVEANDSNKGFQPFMVDAVTALTATSTLTAGQAGLLTVSGAAVITSSLPAASSCPNAEFVFRTLSAHAHVITGSSNIVCTGSVGTKFVLNATLGSSAVLKSDGLAYLCLAFRNTPTIAG